MTKIKRTIRLVILTAMLIIGSIVTECIVWTGSEWIYLILSEALFKIGHVSNQWIAFCDSKMTVFTGIIFIIINTVLYYFIFKKEE